MNLGIYVHLSIDHTNVFTKIIFKMIVVVDLTLCTRFYSGILHTCISSFDYFNGIYFDRLSVIMNM